MADQEKYPVLAFIGAGNMAAAIIGGLLAKGYPPQRIWATDPSREQLDKLAQAWGIRVSCDNDVAVREAQVVVLAVKPQVLKPVCEAMQSALAAAQPLVISIAAGILCRSIERWVGGPVALVRCMPNTPALVETGASALYANGEVSAGQKALAEQVLGSVGLALWVEEETQLDAVTAVSGSGPAYYFLLMEAMISAGEKQGLSREVSTQLTLQTALGAARMAQASDVEPAELRRRVTSPKGTTERAILAFQQGGLEALVEKAMKECAQRSRELGEELGGKGEDTPL